jgi:heat shock protein HtpX
MEQIRKTNLRAGIRTTILLATLTGLLVVIGALVGGPQMALLFLGIGLVMNLGMFWFSDKIALAMSRAQPIGSDQAPGLHRIVRELSFAAGIPMPRLYVVAEAQPNAFACGRNPDNAAVAVTEGVTRLLSEDELRGVLAHELAHIRNRDTLTQAVAAAIGGAITWIAYMLLWFRDDRSPLGLVAALGMVILAPIAATLVQLGISRQREYAADATGARIAGSAAGLAGALAKLESAAQALPMEVNPSTEPLYIVKPFAGRGVASLFSTHPPIEERIKRLRALESTAPPV